MCKFGPDIIERYQEGLITKNEASRLEYHFDDCQECQSYYIAITNRDGKTILDYEEGKPLYIYQDAILHVKDGVGTLINNEPPQNKII
jgi:hypothetical protein